MSDSGRSFPKASPGGTTYSPPRSIPVGEIPLSGVWRPPITSIRHAFSLAASCRGSAHVRRFLILQPNLDKNLTLLCDYCHTNRATLYLIVFAGFLLSRKWHVKLDSSGIILHSGGLAAGSVKNSNSLPLHGIRLAL